MILRSSHKHFTINDALLLLVPPYRFADIRREGGA